MQQQQQNQQHVLCRFLQAVVSDSNKTRRKPEGGKGTQEDQCKGKIVSLPWSRDGMNFSLALGWGQLSPG